MRCAPAGVPTRLSYQGRFYRIAPPEVGPKPVQSHIPVLLGSMTPAGVARAARTAGGISPIVLSEEVLRGSISAFHDAAREQGRDPSDLTVVARANVPVTVDPIGEGRPFLGGSPRQIADDLARLDGAGVDQVLFSNAAAKDINEEVSVLEELQRIVTG